MSANLDPPCGKCGQPGMGWITHVCPPAPMWNTVPVQRAPVRCPVCKGRGTMPHDFYEQLGVASSTNRVRCRSCHGRGIV